MALSKNTLLRFSSGLVRTLLFYLHIFPLCFCGQVFAYRDSSYSNTPIAVDSRLKTFVYSENEVFPIVLQYGFQTNIEFSKEEAIQVYSLGNNYAWQISSSGRIIFIKPLEEGIMTNMIVRTNKRVYYFELISRPSSDNFSQEVAYAIRFFYPNNKDNLENPQQGSSSAVAINNTDSQASFNNRSSATSTRRGAYSGNVDRRAGNKARYNSTNNMYNNVNSDEAYSKVLSNDTDNIDETYKAKSRAPKISPYNFDYRISGNSAVAPDVAFDDGINTYFQYNSGINQKLKVELIDTKSTLNHRIVGNYVVVNKTGHSFSIVPEQTLKNSEFIRRNARNNSRSRSAAFIHRLSR